mgnify:CR=1 FL=1
MEFSSDQEGFWAEEYSKEYIEKNSQFDDLKGAECWSKILHCTNYEISNFLELGCNVGRNIKQLQTVLPSAKPSAIEISKEAFQYANSKFTFENSFNSRNTKLGKVFKKLHNRRLHDAHQYLRNEHAVM